MTCFRSFLVELLLALFLITGGLPGSAFASEVDLVQIGGTAVCTPGGGTGGEDICTGAAGDTMTFATTMEIDAAGTIAWSIDLQWDQNLENALTFMHSEQPNSLNFPNPTPPPTRIGFTVGTHWYTTQQSSPTQGGFVEAITEAYVQDPSLSIANTSFRAGTVTFSIDATNQTALNFGFFRTDGAVMGSSAAQFITPTFGSWVINQAPEPGTSLLMGLGLLGLVMGGRTTRSQRKHRQ